MQRWEEEGKTKLLTKDKNKRDEERDDDEKYRTKGQKCSGRAANKRDTEKNEKEDLAAVVFSLMSINISSG